MASHGRPVVLTDPTLLVRRGNERLLIQRDGKTVAAVPLQDVSHLALHGPITVTGAALAGLLDRGIDVTLYSSAGQLRGTLSAAQSGNVYLVLAQAAAWNDPARRLAFARTVTASKVCGQRLVLQRAAIDRGSSACGAAVDQLAELERRAGQSDSLDALRGLEGAAAAAYFGVFSEMLSSPWSFPGRVRRPPTDPVNALLSFGYTLAGGELARHLQWAGFDLRIGLIHGLRYGRESLPLDLLEEVRAPLVDRFVLRLINRRVLQLEDFERTNDGACRLTPDARVRYLTAWEEMLAATAARLRNEPDAPVRDDGDAPLRLDRAAQEAAEGDASSWRARLERQTYRLQKFLLRDMPYRPLQSSRKPKERASAASPSVTGPQRAQGAANSAEADDKDDP